MTTENKHPRSVRRYGTNELAALFNVVPHTVRVSCSLRGEYMGIRPVKLPNGRLSFDANTADAVASGKAA